MDLSRLPVMQVHRVAFLDAEIKHAVVRLKRITEQSPEKSSTRYRAQPSFDTRSITSRWSLRPPVRPRRVAGIPALPAGRRPP